MSARTTVRQAWRSRAAALAAAALAAAVVVGGCGDDDGGGGGGGGATSAGGNGAVDAEGLAAAKAAVQEFLKLPEEIGISTPITKDIPTGKKVVYIYCGVPICNTYSDATQRAADVLGWEYETIASDGTPEGVKKAWQTAVRMKPDAVLSSGFDTPIYKAELEQLKAMDIPVFNYATTDPGPTGNVTARIGGPEAVGRQGEMQAAWVVADTEGKPNVLYVDVPAFTILKPVADTFDTKYEEWCPGCPVEHLSLPITALAKDAPQRVVSYLRSHPDVNYVVYSVDAASIGLPAALKAAGLDGKVKFMGASGTVENLGYVASGQEAATVNQGYYEEMVALVDSAARVMTDTPLDEIHSWPIPYWLETQDSIRSTEGFSPAVPDLYGKAAELWGK